MLKLPLVFASAYLSKACAFGFRGSDQEKLFNGMIEGTDAEMVLLCDRDKTLARPRDITVYSFADPVTGQTLYHGMTNATGDEIRPGTGYGAAIPDDVKKKLIEGYTGFIDLPDMQRQCVSEKPVPFAKTQIALKAKSAEDMMRAGLQILILRKPITELLDTDFDKEARAKGLTLNQYLGSLVREGKIIWENNARGINPNPEFARQLDVKLKTPQQRLSAKKHSAAKPKF